MEKSKTDSIELSTDFSQDTLNQREAGISLADSTNLIFSDQERSPIKNAISNLFFPNGDYSGILLVLIGVRTIQGWLSLVPGYIVLVILIFMTNKKMINYKRVLIYSLLFLLFMIVFLALNFNELKYGFWICLCLGFINTMIAGFILKRSENKHPVPNN
jgi:hypothetical protein